MAKLTIDLDPDTHDKLVELAKADYRSLTNYIHIILIRYANSASGSDLISPMRPNSSVSYSPHKKTII